MNYLQSTAAAAALLGAAPVWAQSVPEPAQAPSDKDVVVTAQRREQAAQDVPISLHVIGANEIEARRIRTPEDAFNATANVQFNILGDGADGAGVSVRGVSAAGAFGVDQGVALYIDGVYLGSEATLNPRLLDIQRIEVLRGPQGTLYGRNALGGAVNFITERPELGAVHGHLEGQYGSFNEAGTRGMLNLPLGSTAALRVNGFGLWSDGYVRNSDGTRFQTEKDRGGRAQLRWQPDARVDVLASGSYTKYDGNTYGIGELSTLLQGRRVNQAIPFLNGKEQFDGLLNFTWHAGGVDVTSITGFLGANAFGGGGDFSASPFLGQGYSRHYRQLSQELRAASAPGGRLDWVAGLYAFGSRERRVDYYGFNFPLPANSFFPGQPALPAGYQEASTPLIKAWNYAAFGDLTFHLTDRLDVIGGARLNYDRRVIDYDHHTNFVPGFYLFAPPQRFTERIDDTTVQPRFGLNYKAAPTLNLYATISRGRKSAGFNPSFAFSNDLAYKAETGWNYEVGAKGSALDRRLTFSVSAFDFEWDNKQAYYFNGLFVTIANAPKARSYGGEAEVSLRPVRGLELGAQVGLLHSRFTDFPQAGDQSTGGSVNATGFRLPLAPSFSTDLSAQYTHQLGHGRSVFGRLDWNYRSSFYFDVLQRQRQEGYGLLNATLGLDVGRIEATLFARNLTDERYLVFPYRTTEGALATPRTIGGTVRVKW